MADDVSIVIGIQANPAGGKVIKSTLDDIVRSGERAQQSASTLDNQIKKLNATFGAFNRTMGALGVGFGVQQLVKMVDGFAQVQGRLTNATRSASEAAIAFERLRDIAANTGTDLDTAVSVFQRLSFVRDEISATADEMLRFTDTVSKLGVVSGASQTAMQAGLLQLGQSLSSSLVRAEEFNSIMENIPAVGVEIAKQLGVTTGQMRLLVLEGQLLSEDVFTAILKAQDEANAKFEQMPMTISRAFAELYTRTSESVGSLAEVLNIAEILHGVFEAIGDAIESIIGLIKGFANTFKAGFSGIIGGILMGWTDDPLMKQALSDATAEDIKKLGKEAGDGFRQGFDGAADVFGIDTKTPDSVLRVGTGTNRQFVNDYKELVAQIGKGNEAKKAAQKIEKDLAAVVKETRTETEALYDTIADMERLRPFAKTTEQADAITRSISAAHKELDELAVKAELEGPVGQAFKSLAGEIDDGFKDAFKSAFTETEGGWKKMLAGLKATFIDFVADLAYQALARPIVLSVIGGVGGFMGLSSGAVSTGLGTNTTTGGSSVGVGDLFSLGRSGLGSSFGGVTNAINGFGAKIGFGGYGPGMSSFTSASLSSVLGAAGIGFGAGGLLAGLMGGNQMGGSIGGGLGAGIGMAAGGPIGAIVGGLGGSVLGGMFGGGIKRETLGATISRNEAGLLTYRANSNKEGAAQWGKAVTDSLNSIAMALDATFTNGLGSVETNIGSKDKKTSIWHSQVTSKNASDINSIVRYVLGRGDFLAGADAQLLGVANRSARMGSGAGQIVSDINLAKQILGIDNETEDALKAINKQFDDLEARAVKLGLPLAKINEVLDKQREAAIGAVKAMEAGFSSLEDMTATFKAFLDGQALGANSSLSPMGKLGLAQDNYDALLSKAQGGDLSVTKDLLAAAGVVIDVGRSIFASSKGFADLEALIRTDVKEIARAAGVPGYASGTGYAAQGLAWVGERGPELVRFRGGEQVYNASQSQEIARSGARSDAAMMALLTRIAEAAENQAQEMAFLKAEQRRATALAKVRESAR